MHRHIARNIVISFMTLIILSVLIMLWRRNRSSFHTINLNDITYMTKGLWYQFHRGMGSAGAPSASCMSYSGRLDTYLSSCSSTQSFSNPSSVIVVRFCKYQLRWYWLWCKPLITRTSLQQNLWCIIIRPSFEPRQSSRPANCSEISYDQSDGFMETYIQW
jgi:hypothetical protein